MKPAGILVLCFAAATLTSCAADQRPPYIYADPQADVEFYERVVEENPDNTYARQRLQEARAALARDYAWDARRALDRGYSHEALRLARKAAQYDPRYEDLQDEAARRVADIYLNDAAYALESFDFDQARRSLREAEAVRPGSTAARRLRERLDAREAGFYAELAREYTDDGDWEAALQAVDRAVELQPSNAALRRLREDVIASNRDAYLFDRVEQIRARIIAGDLDAAEQTVERLEQGDFDAAILAGLRDRITEQRARAQQAIETARQALREERFEQAAEHLLLAEELDAGIRADDLLREARRGLARSHLMAAIESGNPLEALITARDTLTLIDDPTIERLIPQLEQTLIMETLRDARTLVREQKPQQARELIEQTLEHVESQELRELLASID